MMENPSFRASSEPMGASGARPGGRESVIDQECFFEGTFRTPGNMRIEGTYQGAIECQGTLMIAETGQVNARVVAGNLIVGGQYTGEAQCESRFEVLRTGRVSGAVLATSTVVHDGAFFEGEIRMGARDAAAADARGTALPAGAAGTGALSAPATAARPAAGMAIAPRRRSGTEATADASAEPPSPTEDKASAAPHTNGRSQPAGGRDVLPNRTGEP